MVSKKVTHLLTLIVMWIGSSSAQQMQEAEEPKEVGLTSISDSLSDNTQNSLPMNLTHFSASKAHVVAEDLQGGVPYCFTMTIRSETAFTGRVSFETDLVYYGKHTPLKMPDTRGKWQRVSFFFSNGTRYEQRYDTFWKEPRRKTV